MTHRGERGQATVEFALIIPVVFVALLAVVQVAVLATTQLAAAHTAREVARALAVDPAVDIGHLIEQTAPGGADGLRTEVHIIPSPIGDRESVCVKLIYEVQPISSIFGPFLRDLEVRAEAKMLIES